MSSETAFGVGADSDISYDFRHVETALAFHHPHPKRDLESCGRPARELSVVHDYRDVMSEALIAHLGLLPKHLPAVFPGHSVKKLGFL